MVKVMAFDDTQSRVAPVVLGRLKFVKSLVGRGQPGFAGFFKDTATQVEYLIKEDTPDTCVLEGSARFSSELLPADFANSVNYARAGTLEITGTHGGIIDAVAISVQLRVMPTSRSPETDILPWDVIVYGRKRNPKTLWSEESSHAKDILQNVSMMNSKAQWNLAFGIFISTVVGDESLHVGQFMAEREKTTGRIVGLTRIDFGARERYADMRLRDHDFRHTTSRAYSSSGQKGKHYVDYLLSSPAIKRRYALLWEKTIEVNRRALAQSHGQVLLEELQHIPSPLLEKAVEEVWGVLQRKIKGSAPRSMGELCAHLSEITERRMIEMAKDSALKPLHQPFIELNRKQKSMAALSPEEQHALSEWYLCREELRVVQKKPPFQPFYFALLNRAFLQWVVSNLEIYKRQTGGQKVEMITRAIGVTKEKMPKNGDAPPVEGEEDVFDDNLLWLGESFANEISQHRSRSLMRRADERKDLSRGAQLISNLLLVQKNYACRRDWAKSLDMGRT